jgi:hypothetical protein
MSSSSINELRINEVTSTNNMIYVGEYQPSDEELDKMIIDEMMIKYNTDFIMIANIKYKLLMKDKILTFCQLIKRYNINLVEVREGRFLHHCDLCKKSDVPFLNPQALKCTICQGKRGMSMDEINDLLDKQQLEKDRLYLQTIVPNPKKIEGLILKLSDLSYVFSSTDLYYLNTLHLQTPGPDYDQILVFKQCEEQLNLQSSDRLQVLSHYSFIQGSMILSKEKIAEIPRPLKDLLIKGDYQTAYRWLFRAKDTHIPSSFEEMIDNVYDPLSKYYNEGEMISLKQIKRNPVWKKENEKQLEIKLVHICKSCGKKANKHCCSNYHSSNRVKIKMIIGWSPHH